MRIDPTQGLTPQAPPGGKPNPQKPAEPQGGANAEPAVDGVEIRSKHVGLLRQAAAVDQIDQAAVAEARRLLAEAKLDTPDAARRAAEAILRLGL
jgi:hypothetical protein